MVPIVESQRHELASHMAGFAHRNGFYLRDSSNYMRDTAGTLSFYVVIYRGLANGDEWLEIQAHAADHEDPIITFNRPTSEASAADRTWRKFIEETAKRWPRSAHVPILPHGGVPHAKDLVWTTDGFRIDPAKANSYELPSGSNLLAN